MNKFKKLFFSVVCLLVGGAIFASGNEKIEVSNVEKASDITIGNAVCFKDEAQAKNYAEQASGKEIKPVLTYMYGSIQPKNDAGTDVYYCDNPDASIRTFNLCTFDGYYLDEELTRPVSPTKVGDVLKSITYEKDSDGCITGINYITVLYAKCKSSSDTVTPQPTVTQSVTTTPTKDNDSSNPETGDMILLYVGAGVILLAGCALVLKKFSTNK